MMLKHRILTFATLVLFFALLSSHAIASKNIAIVFQVKGAAKIKKVENEKFKSLKKGVHIDSGDMIKTGEDGSVALIFTDDKSLLRIRSNTETVIQGKREMTSISKRINMEVGALWVNIKEGKGEFKVATPTSVASVKGTEFWVLVDKIGDTDVICLKGLIELHNTISAKAIDVSKEYTGKSTRAGELAVEKTKRDAIPKRDEIEGNEIEIEFEDEHGNKKTLKIKFE